METFGKTWRLKNDVEILGWNMRSMIFRDSSIFWHSDLGLKKRSMKSDMQKYLVPCTAHNQTTLSGYVKCAEKEV